MEPSLTILDKSNKSRRMSRNAVPAFWLYGERRDGRFPDALHIETIVARSSLHNWRIEPHRHRDLHQFFFLSSGGGHAGIDGEHRELRAGTAIAMPPLVVHEFLFDTGTDGFVASVPESTLRRLCLAEAGAANALSKPLLQEASPAAARELASTMAAALAEFTRHHPSREIALAAHAELIAIWFARAASCYDTHSETARDTHIPVLRRFVELVEADFVSHKPLSFYSDTLGISIPQLTRICRGVLGCPAIQVIHDRLMLEARRQLVYTSTNVAQIAYGLGFSDPAYFSRFFAARAGMAPSRYRAGG
jgi:AraC family transcriptional activator of pobA